MDNKIIIDADFKYATRIHLFFGKELLENETAMSDFIKTLESDGFVKEVRYYESSDGKRHFVSKTEAIQYEMLCYTCSKIKEMEDKRAALVKLIRLCGDVITSYKNYDYTHNFYPIADAIEKKRHCAIRCCVWKILADFQDTFPCLFSTYMHLACLVLSED